MFRERIVASILSKNPLKIEKIRHKDQESPGLQDFEASFLRLVEAISDGAFVEINETGTTLRVKPGVLVGGGMAGRPLVHNCGTSRSIGWFIEGLLPLGTQIRKYA
jgi:RNA 3'-terminal phosphate cyclase-like protein